MKRFFTITISLLCVFSILTGCSKQPDTTESPTYPDTLESEVSVTSAPTETLSWNEQICRDFDDRITQTQFTGAVYAAYKGEGFYSFGNGKADKTAGIANTADTVFYAASLTKQFTAAAVLRLCEEGKLSPDDAIGKYFPEYPAGANITLHQLLSMQSGIADYVSLYDDSGSEIGIKEQSDIPDLSEDNSAAENRKAVEDYIFGKPLLFEPGDRYSYSNSNYVLLGGIIEKVSGESWFDYIKTNFFEPLALDSAGFSEGYEKDGYTVAKPYHREEGGEYFRYKGAAFACGDIMISPRDMSRWTEALHNGRVLGREMYELMTSAHVNTQFDVPDDAPASEYAEQGYGYGLLAVSALGFKMYYHEGHINSYYTLALSVPSCGLTLVLMSNYARSNIDSAAALMVKDFRTAYSEAAMDCYPYSPTLPE